MSRAKNHPSPENSLVLIKGNPAEVPIKVRTVIKIREEAAVMGNGPPRKISEPTTRIRMEIRRDLVQALRI